MNEENLSIRNKLYREKRANGILFGLVAGLALSIGMWGLDAYLLSQAHVGWAWLKLLIGAPFLLLVSAIAGWLTARFDSGLIGAIIWLLASLVMVWFASHVPFQGLSLLIGCLKPDLAGLDIYPFVESARARMSFLYIVVGVLMAIGGGFEMFFVEAATRASSWSSRLLNLLICMLIFIPVGLTVDNLINASLRAPLVSLNDLIQFGLQAEVTPVSIQEKRAMGLSSIASFGSRIHQSYSLYLGTYDPQSFSDSSIYVDFNGEWGVCFAYGDRIMFCQLSKDRYIQRFACLAASEFTSGCEVRATEEIKDQVRKLAAQLAGEPAKFGVLSQAGSAVLLVEETSQGEQFQCVFRETGDVVLDSCRLTTNRVFYPIQLVKIEDGRVVTPTPVAPASLPQLVLDDFSPQVVLIDPGQLNLPVLKSAPRYAITVEIKPNEYSFKGREVVKFTNNEQVDLNALYFRLFPNGKGSYGDGALTVTGLSVAGKPAEGEFSVNDTVLKIPLPTNLQPGQSMEVGLDFKGAIPQETGDASTAGYGIYSFRDGVLALSGWYPLLAVYDAQGWNLDAPSVIGDSVYSDIGFYSVDIVLPGDMILAATGVQTGSQIINGTTRYHYDSGPARDFTLLASSGFKVVSQPVGQTVVNAYYLSGQDEAGRIALDVAAGSLEIYNEKFGSYPYKELDVVESPLRYALGVEYPGIIMIGAALYDAPEKPDFEVTLAHEVAHQWWYNVVGNDVFDEPWLDEALATYSSSLFYEFERGPAYVQGLQSYWQERYDKALRETGDDLVTADLKHFESLSKASVYGAIVYTKGALFFKALRQEIGDQAFFQALSDYYQSHLFQIGQASDLLEAFQQASGKELDGLYQKWLYSIQ